MAKHEELIWLTGNLKLEVIEYSRQIYGPREHTHLGDDDDDGDDPKKTSSCWPRKRHYR